MMKHALYIILVFLIVSEGNAQSNLHTVVGYRGSVAAAMLLPSTHQMTDFKFEINVNYNAWVANKSITYGSLRDIYRSNSLSTQDVSNIISELDDNNRIGAGQNFLVFGLGLRTLIKEHPVTWNFTISDRLNTNLLIPKTLVELVWLGNKPFEGQTVDISNTTLAGIYYRDYSLGFATPVAEWGDWKSGVGLHLSYLQGLAGITNSENQIYFTTATGAEYLELDYDFDFRYVGIEDFDLFRTRGNGFGLGLGTTFSYKDVLYFDLALTDIGKIKYDRLVNYLVDDTTFHFTGLGHEELVDPYAFLDSLETIFTPKIDSLGNNYFKVPVGMRLSFMASWVFGEENKNHGPATLSLLYSQGFSEQPGSTISPEFSLIIHRRMLRYGMFGLNVSLGGFNNIAVGAQLGMHFKNFRFSLHSDNLTGFIFPNTATGAAAGLMMQILF